VHTSEPELGWVNQSTSQLRISIRTPDPSFTSPEQQSTEITLMQSKSIPFHPILNSKGENKNYLSQLQQQKSNGKQISNDPEKRKERKGTSH